MHNHTYRQSPMTKTITILALLATSILLGQNKDSTVVKQTFNLGEVTIYGSPLNHTNTVNASEISKFNRNEVSTALNTLAGVTMGNVGPRNESVVHIRGFDLRQVPVFLDGIPIYVPYDGYVDMGRFTTFDLAQINVSKGFSSMTYGANAMGGAINLVSSKPVKKFELHAKVGLFSGNGFLWNINTGAKSDKFFYQIDVSQIKQDYYPMSKDFTAVENENGDHRENAYRDDKKFSAKFGYTPNETDQYVLVYSIQNGKKGTPPYVGSDEDIKARFWQWPKWNKQSLYFLSDHTIGSKHKLKSRLYYDTFVNELFSYDDPTYSSMTRPYTFKSYYDDYTLGGNIEFESHHIKNNTLKLAVQFKRDVHRENDQNEPQRDFIDNTWSVALENTYTLSPTLKLIPGLS